MADDTSTVPKRKTLPEFAAPTVDAAVSDADAGDARHEPDNVRHFAAPGGPHLVSASSFASARHRDTEEAESAHDERPLVAAKIPGPALDQNPFKLGILGGRQSGKSYLFQSMVYRLFRGSFGPMAYFKGDDAITVYAADANRTLTGSELSDFGPLHIDALVRDFQLWYRLPATRREQQRWYRLQLPFRSGWFGQRRSTIEVAFLDGSGEYFENDVRSDQDVALWSEAFLDAKVIVFCLPMWCAFPYMPSLKDPDIEERQIRLEAFDKVVTTYRFLRQAARSTARVRAIVALTMADDVRCAEVPQHVWISEYVKNADANLRRLRSGSGVSRYLAHARKVSRYLLDMCESPSVPAVVNNLRQLDFGLGLPWLIPVSALDGHMLSTVERDRPSPAQRARKGPPVPAHAELPVLIALAEHYNALA